MGFRILQRLIWGYSVCLTDIENVVLEELTVWACPLKEFELFACVFGISTLSIGRERGGVVVERRTPNREVFEFNPHRCHHVVSLSKTH